MFDYAIGGKGCSIAQRADQQRSFKQLALPRIEALRYRNTSAMLLSLKSSPFPSFLFPGGMSLSEASLL